MLYAIQALDDSCHGRAPVRDAPWVDEDLESNAVENTTQAAASFSGQRLQQLLLLAMQRHALTGDGVTTVDEVMQAYSTNLIGQRAKQLDREQEAVERAGRTVVEAHKYPTSAPRSSGSLTMAQQTDPSMEPTAYPVPLVPTTTTAPPFDPALPSSTNGLAFATNGVPTDPSTDFDPIFTPEVLDQLLTELTQDQAGLPVQALLDDPFLTGGTHVHGQRDFV